MPFNVIGWCEATPGTGTVNLAAGLGDNLYETNGDYISVTAEAPYLIGLFGIGTSTLGDVLIRQPKMIDLAFKKTSLVADVAPLCSFTNLLGRPFELRPGYTQALVVNATDEASLVGCFLSTGKITQTMLDAVNPTHLISGYSDTTVTAYTWSHVPITWNQTLEKGTYEVVGMRATIFGQTEMGLARLSIPGNKTWMPGVPCGQASADHEEWQSLEEMPLYHWPLMGVRFSVPGQMPNIEVLAIAADTDENVELMLQRVE